MKTTFFYKIEPIIGRKTLFLHYGQLYRIFEYYSEGESGNDKYRFTSKTEALEQMAELKQAIKVNFADSTETETIEEPDFYGIMDLKSGDFAKVVLREEIRG